MPERAPDPDSVIVGALGSTVYLQPLVTREYPTRAYTLLQNPQALGTETSGWTWIDGEPLTDAQLEVVDGARVVSRAELQPYRVQQLAGEARGYEVLPYTPDAWIKEDATKIGYEISFTRHFYKPPPLRTLEEISADILAIEKEAEGLLDGLLKGSH